MARALEFIILTAARVSEVLRATRWSEIDMDSQGLDRAGGQDQGRQDALRSLVARGHGNTDQGPRECHEHLRFPRSGYRKAAVSFPAMLKVLKVVGCGDATVHGFRSTFRDWASERTHYPLHVAEMALAHAIGDQVEAAYRRGDLSSPPQADDGGVGASSAPSRARAERWCPSAWR